MDNLENTYNIFRFRYRSMFSSDFKFQLVVWLCGFVAVVLVVLLWLWVCLVGGGWWLLVMPLILLEVDTYVPSFCRSIHICL